ncbi:MAG: HAD family hydrolase [Candidatus Aenigmarchaeota archaeon]|nr:HAD family hydrolase [Candidatus Aenigmarchaeota archaeon]
MKAIIFDLEGVLCDTREWMNHSVRSAFFEHGIELEFSDKELYNIRGCAGCLNSPEWIQVLLAFNGKNYINKIYELDKPEEFIVSVLEKEKPDKLLAGEINKTYREIYYSQKNQFRTPLSGIKEVLEKLRPNFSFGIFSNTKHDSILKLLDNAGIRGYFSIVVGQEDVSKQKPDPEGLLKAIAELKSTPQETIYIGDTASDVQAARAAGCVPIGLLTGMGIERWLRAAGAVHIFPTLKEFIQSTAIVQ